MRVVPRHGLSWMKGFLPFIIFLIGWELWPSADGSPYFPPPSDWWRDISEQRTVSEVVSELVRTLRTVVIGLVVATVIGSVVGIAIGFFRTVRLSLSTTLEFLRALPAPVIVPISMLAFGIGETMKVFCVVFACVWPILLNSASAAGATHPLMLDMAKTFHLSRADQVRKIILPGTIPAILLGVRVALPVAVILTILVEMLGSNDGIGSLLMDAQRQYRAAEAYALLFIVGFFGYALNALFSRIGWYWLRRWPEDQAAAG